MKTVRDHDFIAACDHADTDCWIKGQCHKRSGEIGDLICGSPESEHWKVGDETSSRDEILYGHPDIKEKVLSSMVKVWNA